MRWPKPAGDPIHKASTAADILKSRDSSEAQLHNGCEWCNYRSYSNRVQPSRSCYRTGAKQLAEAQSGRLGLGKPFSSQEQA